MHTRGILGSLILPAMSDRFRKRKLFLSICLVGMIPGLFALALAVRAVAAANGTNEISIIVPCHRIIDSKGVLTGYAGGTAEKKQLIKLEGGYSDQP